MKPFFSLFPLAAVVALLGVAPVSTAWGQVTSRTTVTQTPDVSGEFSQWIPGTHTVVVNETGAEPMRYMVTKTTTVVDENGNPLVIERVAPGAPMTVRYARTPEGLVASRIVVHSPPRRIIEREAVSTAVAPLPTPEPVPVPGPAAVRVITGRGTIEEFSPASETVVLGGGERYVLTKRTTYVDEAGAPIAVDQITRGAPVTVDYVDEGGHRVVSKVIVHRHVATPAQGVIEHRTTTTTTEPKR